MAGSGDEIAGWGGRGYLRASHADREQVVGALKAAFVAGMLAKDEFGLRVGQALASRTYAELADLTADLPAEVVATHQPGPARPPGGQPLLRPGQIITGATMLYAGAWLFAPSPAGPALVVLGGFFYLFVLAIAVAVAFENQRDRRSGGQLPHGRPPGAGGPAFRRLPPAGPGGELPPVDPGQYPAAEVTRKRRSPPPSLERCHCASASVAAATVAASG